MRLQLWTTALLAGAVTASPAIPLEARQAATGAGFAQGQPFSADGKGGPLLGDTTESIA